MQRQGIRILRLLILRLGLLWLSVWFLGACISADPLTIQPPANSEAPASDLAAIAQPPARHPIQNDVLYFVLPDRFANGSTENDTGGLEGDRLITGFDPTDKGFYHGGDIAGLISKLDYLEQLGVTAIWMTPLFKNKVVQGQSADPSAAYHGYWIVDFTQLDPHFGANAELEALIEEAHSREIKIFFDLITNHTADVIQYEDGQSSYRSKLEYPYRDARGTAFDDLNYAGTGKFPTLSIAESFPYIPVIPQAERTIKIPAWLNAPIYYHNRGNSQFSGENSLYGDFSGLDDLFTEHPKVVEGMIDIYKGWISDYEIDGFRIDTVKHVNAHFWRAFSDAILAHAQATGKSEFFIFGEVFSGNENLLSYYTTDSDMPGVLDFGLQGNVREYVSRGGAASNLAGFFEYDDIYIDEDSNVYSLPTFIGNHDMGRFGYFLLADNDNLSHDELVARMKLAHALLFFARGVPVIYYGDEQGFAGDGGDKDARQDMFSSQVTSYNDDDLFGTDATTADDNFDPDHPLYQAFSRYASLWQSNAALMTGAQIHRYADAGAGIYAFSRIDRDEQSEYIIAFNNGEAATAEVPTFYDEGVVFTMLYNEGGEVADALTTTVGGLLPVNVPALGFVVYKASTEIPASTTPPAVTIASPAPNQTVTLGFQEIDGNQVPERIEVRAALTSSQYLEVTFAVRAAGSEDFALIGVDDNPPYRVFYDASSWPDGTQLDFIAVVNDLNDHYSSALVEGVTPVYQRPAPPDPRASAYPYAVVHYQREDGDYGDPATGDANDFWGLHVWGDGLASGEATDWTMPKAFVGEDSYGRFAWVKLLDASKDIGFIVHQGDTKDGTEEDRFFNPLDDGGEIWLKQDDPTFYTSQAAAQGFVSIHYNRPDGEYDEWGLHLWGDGIEDDVATEWESPRPADGEDNFGLYWNVPIVDAALPLNFIIHRGEEKDPGPDQSLLPQENASVWIKSGDETIYPQLCAATSTARIHYHRPAGDYGDYASDDFADFWGLHAWNAAEDPGWQTPYKPSATDLFGIIFELAVDQSKEPGYIIHQGDTKDPGPDQFLNFEKWGCEVWQVQEAEPEAPYVLPLLKPELP
jgi:glycosidase